MTDLELIFAMLGEKVTTEISQSEKPDTFESKKWPAVVAELPVPPELRRKRVESQRGQ